ncbi:hypothetical protein Tco_0224043 [Tanacetum coccineum]
MLKVSPRKGVVCFGKWGKLNPRYVGPFKVLAKVGAAAYKLELPQELSRVHNTFHVSNLKKYYSNKPLAVPSDGLHIDDKLCFEAVTHVMRRSSVPVMEIMPIDQVLFDQLSSSHVYRAFYGALIRAFYMAFKEKARRSSRRRLRASKGPSMGRRPGTLTGPTIGASRRRPRGFEEKAKGLLRTQQMTKAYASSFKRVRHHPLYTWLLQMLHDIVKAATRLAGSYEGCHIGCSLSRRLPHCWHAATKVAVVNATTDFAGLCGGCHISCRDALTLRLRGGAFYGAFDRAFEEKARGSSRRGSGASAGPSTRRKSGDLIGPSIGPSRRRPEGFKEKVGGRKRRLHLLGEYVTSGKLCIYGDLGPIPGMTLAQALTINLVYGMPTSKVLVIMGLFDMRKLKQNMSDSKWDVKPAWGASS